MPRPVPVCHAMLISEAPKVEIFEEAGGGGAERGRAGQAGQGV